MTQTVGSLYHRSVVLAGRRDVLGGLVSAIGFNYVQSVRAARNPELLDIRRYVYVPSAEAPEVTVVDIESNRILETLPTGIVAREAVISRDAATLVFADGRSQSVTLVDVFGGGTRQVALPIVAQRLTVSANGQMVAVNDLAGRAIALIDLGGAQIVAQMSGLPPLRDVMFGQQDRVLYIAAEGLTGIGMIDIGTFRLSGAIEVFKTAGEDNSALARTTDGRRILALSQSGDQISVFDPSQETPLARLTVRRASAGIFPSGLGTYLLVPDNEAEKLTVFRSAHLEDSVALPGAADVVGVYATWLDSVAFMPNASRRSVLVYDLDKMRLVDTIQLHGTPARGSVTADTRMLYLPVRDPPELLAIDGQTRRVTQTLELPTQPLAALIAGGSGVCH